MDTVLVPKHPVFQSVDQLLMPEQISEIISEKVSFVKKEPFGEHSGAAGSQLSRICTDKGQYVLKEMSIDSDWIMYTTNDTHGRSVRLWQYGLLDELLPAVEHKIIACSRTGNHWAILMEDLSGTVFTWDHQMNSDQVYLFLDILAQFHAHFWNDYRLEDESLGLADTCDLLGLGFHSLNEKSEEEGRIPDWTKAGWQAVREILSPAVFESIVNLSRDPSALTNFLDDLPSTLLHGDYRADNLAVADKPVIIDWQQAARSLMTIDLSWLTKKGYVRNTIGEDHAIHFYRNRLQSYLGHRFDDQKWKMMVDIGYGLDAIHYFFVSGIIYANEKNPEWKQNNLNEIKNQGDYVMNALRWV